jgi:glutathione S-transferase
VEKVDIVFKAHLDSYKYPDRYGHARDFHRDAGMEILQGFDVLCERQGYLAGPAFSLIDAAIFPFVRQFAAVDEHWFEVQHVPALQAWLAGICESAMFQTVMETYPIWQSGHQGDAFPRLA